MSIEVLSQIDRRWSAHLLGSRGRPGTIGQYGCDVTVDTMIVNDALGQHFTPATLDELYVAKGDFQAEADGTYDLLSDAALEVAFPGKIRATALPGFQLAAIKAAIPSPDTWVKLWITGYSPLWRMNIPTHFVLGWSADGNYIGDPEGGLVRPLSAYGGPANVHRTILYKRLPQAVVIVTPPKVVPAPTPLYSVQFGTAAPAGQFEYARAVEMAAAYAKGNPGTLAAVLDAKGQTVETEFVAVVAPVPPKQIPLPTPAPAHVQQADFWSVLQNVLIQLLAPIARVAHK